jgi:hypothetical protein
MGDDSYGILDSGRFACQVPVCAPDWFTLDPKAHILIVKSGIRKEHLMAETAEAAVEEPEVPPMWELAECTCPDWCERDHEQD